MRHRTAPILAAARGSLSPPSMRTALSDRTWCALLGLFAFAAVYFFLRGPYRAWQGTIDLTAPSFACGMFRS